MKTTIKQFVRNDQQQVKQFVLTVWNEFGFTYNSLYDHDLDDIEEFYFHHGGMFFLLKQENIIIGTIGIINKDNGVAEFKRLYVAKEYRGKGFGAKLVDVSTSYCKDHGFTKIIFETNKVFTIAHQLYQKRGFMLVREDERSFYMEKIL